MAHEPHADQSIGRLVSDASRDISSLISKEIQLAKSELKVSFRLGGAGLALIATAGFLVLLSLVMLSVSIAYLIHANGDGPALQWAFLIVFVGDLVLAGVLVALGIFQISRVRAPERALRQGKEIPRAFAGRS